MVHNSVCVFHGAGNVGIFPLRSLCWFKPDGSRKPEHVLRHVMELAAHCLVRVELLVLVMLSSPGPLAALDVRLNGLQNVLLIQRKVDVVFDIFVVAVFCQAVNQLILSRQAISEAEIENKALHLLQGNARWLH